MPNQLTGDPNLYDLEEIKKNGLSGTCLCGSIAVTIRDPELFDGPKGLICHCWNCRKATGSLASINTIVSRDKVTIEDKKGTLKIFNDEWTESGQTLERYFCSNCGT